MRMTSLSISDFYNIMGLIAARIGGFYSSLGWAGMGTNTDINIRSLRKIIVIYFISLFEIMKEFAAWLLTNFGTLKF